MSGSLKSVEIPVQAELFEELGNFPKQMSLFPRFRYMGSKFRLLPWLHETFSELDFETSVDAFSGSGAVSYLLKSMGKQVHANDTLSFPSVLSAATVENSRTKLSGKDVSMLLAAQSKASSEKFISRTFDGIFYTSEDLCFLDNVWSGIRNLTPQKKSMAIAALLRSAVKRQPRGLFTVAGDPEKYKDGRRDLQLSLQEHFLEQVDVYNDAVFNNGQRNRSSLGDVGSIPVGADLVYMDPPYVPRSDDNCYVKRYHFLEGLSCYWDGKEIMMNSKVRKIVKPFTPFSYRKSACEAFESMFRKFADSTLVLSYSSNAFPDLETLVKLMGRFKKSVEVVEKEHRYHFGTHRSAKRNIVREYLIIGQA